MISLRPTALCGLTGRVDTLGGIALVLLLYWIVSTYAEPPSFKIREDSTKEEMGDAPSLSLEEEARAIVQEMIIDSGTSDLAICAAIHNE